MINQCGHCELNEILTKTILYNRKVSKHFPESVSANNNIDTNSMFFSDNNIKNINITVSKSIMNISKNQYF